MPYKRNNNSYHKQRTEYANIMLYSYNPVIAFFCCLFGGFFGAHYFYIKKWGKGFLYLFTAGLAYCGWIIDIFRILTGNFKKEVFNKYYNEFDPKEYECNKCVSMELDNEDQTATTEALINKYALIADDLLHKGAKRKFYSDDNFSISDDEKDFFSELIKQSDEAGFDYNLFYFEPISDKGFNIRYNNIYLGKIKLSDTKTYMQVCKNSYDIDTFTNLSLNEYIKKIKIWINYIKKIEI